LCCLSAEITTRGSGIPDPTFLQLKN